MTDGLSQLEDRGRRTRRVPPPRHHARTDTVPVEAEQPPAPVAEPHTAATPPPAESRADAAPTPIRPASIYLQQESDAFLEQVAYAGRTARPRVAVSRSAIVRLALEQLAKHMTSSEIVDELRRRGDDHTGTGRKRR